MLNPRGFLKILILYRDNSQKSLQIAKRAIQDDYMVVGLTEDLPSFFMALEHVMPQFFRNGSTVHRTACKSTLQFYWCLMEIF